MTMQIEPEDQTFRGLHHECFDPDCHVPDFIRSVEDIDVISLIRKDVSELKEVVNNLIDLIEPIKDEVTPMVEQISNSPMFKMLTGGK